MTTTERDRADMSAIIASLEAATGPDRELDAAIHVASGNASPGHTDVASCVGCGCAPKYSKSIDAALTLVPGDATGVLMGTNTILGFPKAEVDIYCGRAQIIGNATAETLPLALCIAALKARAVSP